MSWRSQKPQNEGKKVECLGRYSLSQHASFLENFPFVQCSPYLDIYSIFTYEPLHNISLGLPKLLKEMCCQRVYDDTFQTSIQDGGGRYRKFPEIRTALLNGMNHILTCIQRDSPATAFRIDFLMLEEVVVIMVFSSKMDFEKCLKQRATALSTK